MSFAADYVNSDLSMKKSALISKLRAEIYI